MKRWIVVFLLWAYCFLNTFVAYSQTPIFRNYSSTDGLPSSETYCTLQDSRGYMWFATDRGIVKFDGYTFKTFTTSDGLPDNTFFELFEDNKKRIWFKSISATIGYIDQNDSVYPYKYNNILKSYLPSALIISMIVDDDDGLWCSKQNLTKDLMQFRILKNGTLDTSFQYAEKTRRIYINKSGRSLVVGNSLADTIEVYQLETEQLIGKFKSTSIISVDAFASYSKNDNSLMLCTDEQLILFKDGKVKIFATLKGRGRVISFHIDNQDNIWVGYLNHGLEFYSPKDGYTKCVKMFNNQSVSSVNQDREGGLWFTTLENGIYYLPLGYPLSYTDGIEGAKVNRVVVIDDIIVMVLSNKNIVVKDRNQQGAFYSTGKKWASPAIAYSPPNTLYLSIDTIRNNFFPGKREIICVLSTRNIIVGNKYLWGADQTNIEKYFLNGKMIKRSVIENIARITCGVETTDGNLLVGTLGGLYMLVDDKIYPVKKYNPLFKHRVSDIKRIDAEYIAVATIGYGLYIVKEKDFSLVRHITTNDGLPSMMCNAIAVEDKNIMWVGTNFGLCRITSPLTNPSVYTIDAYDGIIANEVNDIFLNNNELWLATSKGVSVVLKNSIVKSIPDIPVYIEKVLVNATVADAKSPLLLSYFDNNISISYTALHYRHPGNLQYKYRLKGEGDSKWHYTTNRTIVYNSLSPGDYTFELGVIKPNGEDNPLLATYVFTISPPFWQTWWFIGLVIIAVITGVYLYIYYRLKFVKSQLKLEEDLNRFRDKALRDQMNPHFIFNSLNSIQNFILKNNAMESVSFLSKFSRLMRLIFTNTSKERVTLESDLESLRLYAELENLRFPNRFTLHINVDPAIDAAFCYIPPLILQPFVENAILHGLLNKDSPGNIWLTIAKEKECMRVTITDDGIGRANAALIKERKARYKEVTVTTRGKTEYSGITATLDRLTQVWGNNLMKNQFKIVDLQDKDNNPAGTTIQFCLPINDD